MHSAETQEGVPPWYFEREIGIFLKIHKCQIVICCCRILGFLGEAKWTKRAKALPLKSSDFAGSPSCVLCNEDHETFSV